MPFQVSPGVNVTEIDLTTVVPAVSSTEGALAGVFRWGPVDERTLVSSESELAARYGKPTNYNAETFFTAANFLAYGNKLYVARAAKTTGASNPTLQLAAGTNFNVGDTVYQRTDGVTNNAVGVVVSVSGNVVTINATSMQGVFTSTANVQSTNASPGDQSVTLVTEDTTIVKTAVANTDLVTNIYKFITKNADHYDIKDSGGEFDDDMDVKYFAKYPGVLGNSLKVSVCDSETAYSTDVQLGSTLGVVAAATGVSVNVGSQSATVTVTTDARYGTLSVANVAGTISAGDVVYQSNGTSNLAIGTIVSANITLGTGTVTLSSNATANVDWSLYSVSSAELVDATSSATAKITGLFITNTPTTLATTAKSALSVGDYIEAGNSSIGKQYLKVASVGDLATNTAAGTVSFSIVTEDRYTLSVDYNSTNDAVNKLTRKWEYFNSVDGAPSTTTYVANFGNTNAKDELHVIVADEDGDITGVPGTVLEVFQGLSRATNAKTEDGATNYYKTVINDVSQYVWFGNDRSGAASATAAAVVTSTNVTPLTLSFNQGQDGADEATVAIGDLTRGFDLFASAEDVDVSLVLTGKARGTSNDNYTQLANYLIDNIGESRKDCVVFASPDKDDVVRVTDGSEETRVVAFRNSARSSSYAVLDSGYKYQYDKYNDIYRWIPLNGDTAGLCVRTDDTRDPWWSPAGFNRGQIKNIVKLAFNPNKAERDVLYKAGVNPVVTFPGQGTILFGDKTLLAKPSAFDRINVRRLFIVLEKAIATAAKYSLFEFNDDFTRAQFRALVEPFLRDVQGRRGIYDFKVVCDTSNNTGEVIDRNEFVGDIYIKPAKSINFIQLNFVAVRTGVEFAEVVGQF